MKVIAEKLRRRGGTSFLELMVTVLIVALVSLILAEIVPSAFRLYQETMDAANAQVLLSTTMTKLRGELSSACKIQIVTEEGPAKIVYQSASGKGQCKIYLAADGVTIQEYDDYAGAKPQPRLLISDTAATHGLSAAYSGVAYDAANGLLTITGLNVQRNGTAIAGAQVDTFAIRTIWKN